MSLHVSGVNKQTLKKIGVDLGLYLCYCVPKACTEFLNAGNYLKEHTGQISVLSSVGKVRNWETVTDNYTKFSIFRCPSILVDVRISVCTCIQSTFVN